MAKSVFRKREEYYVDLIEKAGIRSARFFHDASAFLIHARLVRKRKEGRELRLAKGKEAKVA